MFTTNMTVAEAQRLWAADAAHLAETYGIVLPEVRSYLPNELRAMPFGMAADAQPTLITTSNSGIPAFLTTMVDPDIIRILLAPNKAATIIDEVKKGDWTDQTWMFPVVESTGEVSSYGDFSENGRTGANTNFPQRQSFLYQTIIEYGELELDRAGKARISWASELDQSAVKILNKFQNLSYFRGISNIQNYGLQNDPYLSSSLTPGTKAAGNGNVWVYNNTINATPNEVFLDIQSMFIELVNQTAGLVDEETPMTLALSPVSAMALTSTNSFNVNVNDLLAKNFPKLKIVTAIQYGVLSAANPQGLVAGNFVQLIANEVEGQKVAICSYNEKLRNHPIIRYMSSFRRKQTQGTWGTIVKFPAGIAGMIGI